MKWVYVLLISILNFILQSTVFDALRINGVAINTSLVLVVFMALVFGNRNALTAAVISGLFQDIYYSWAIGVNIFIYFFLAILIDMIDDSVFKDKSLTPLVLLVGSTLFYYIVHSAFMLLLGVSLDWQQIFMNFFIETFMNTVFGLLIYNNLIKKMIGYELR